MESDSEKSGRDQEDDAVDARGGQNLEALASHDKKLVEGLKAGDGRAYEEMVRLYSTRLTSVATGMTGNMADAREIVQEAFLRIFQHIHDFNGNARLYTWMYRIVANLCLDHQRKRRVQMEDLCGVLPYECEIPDRFAVNFLGSMVYRRPPDVLYQMLETMRLVEKALGNLTWKKRDVFELCAMDGLKHGEVAEKLRIPVSTVLTRLHHARTELRFALSRYVFGRPWR